MYKKKTWYQMKIMQLKKKNQLQGKKSESVAFICLKCTRGATTDSPALGITSSCLPKFYDQSQLSDSELVPSHLHGKGYG